MNGSASIPDSSTPHGERRAIYVGNLPIGMTENVLHDIFAIIGSIHGTKLMGKSTLNAVNYAFIEYDDPASAVEAIETFNGRTISGSPLKVNWAYTSSSSAAAREETSTHFSIFVGDLSADVNDDTLRNAFSHFESLSDARVMWDMQSGRSRGYGFCSFESRPDAERAITTMHGSWLGSRSIRCNWANLKQSTSLMDIEITNPLVQQLDADQQYALILSQVSANVSTVYVGNLSLDARLEDLRPLFATYGGAEEIKVHADRGFAFVRLQSHECAALAIMQLQDAIVKGRPVKVSWQTRSENNRQMTSGSAASIQRNYAARAVPEYTSLMSSSANTNGMIPRYLHDTRPMSPSFHPSGPFSPATLTSASH